MNAKFFLLCALLLVGLGIAEIAEAEEALPALVMQQAHTSLHPLGNDTYTKFGFSIYRIRFWSAAPAWDRSKPYALELHYARSLSKETLVDGLSDDFRAQGGVDDATLGRWKDLMNRTLHGVEDGDVLICLARPKEETMLFYNGEKLASIDDASFRDAFFNVWLGEHADQDMKQNLLGKPATVGQGTE